MRAVASAIILYLAGSAHAVPAAAPGVANTVKAALWPSGISGTLSPSKLPELEYFAEYAAAAYCDPNNAPGTEVKCPGSICPQVTSNTVVTQIKFANGKGDTTGIVALDKTTKNIVVAFRGSKSVVNWLTNLAMAPRELNWCKGCKVHSGFMNAYLDRQSEIISKVKSLASANPDYGIVTTGHSLGGALGMLCATDLRRQGYTVTSYSYGSPRIGNEAFVKYISNSGENYRVTHTDDPVPRVPPLLFGYEHVSPEYHITSDSIPCQAKEINILKGYVNFGGNTLDNGVVSMNILAHMRYLTATSISDCAPAGLEFHKE